MNFSAFFHNLTSESKEDDLSSTNWKIQQANLMAKKVTTLTSHADDDPAGIFECYTQHQDDLVSHEN